jgi:hypothetical protein
MQEDRFFSRHYIALCFTGCVVADDINSAGSIHCYAFQVHTIVLVFILVGDLREIFHRDILQRFFFQVPFFVDTDRFGSGNSIMDSYFRLKLLSSAPGSIV